MQNVPNWQTLPNREPFPGCVPWSPITEVQVLQAQVTRLEARLAVLEALHHTHTPMTGVHVISAGTAR